MVQNAGIRGEDVETITFDDRLLKNILISLPIYGHASLSAG